MISLSVNLNKVALLRNSRGAQNPSPRTAGVACLDAGAYGLTLHWRADERHTRPEWTAKGRAVQHVGVHAETRIPEGIRDRRAQARGRRERDLRHVEVLDERADVPRRAGARLTERRRVERYANRS